MSKQRHNQPGIKRVPSTPVPPQARKEATPLQPGPAGTSTGSTPKFYNGPTVPKAAGIPDYSKDVAKKTVQTAKVQGRKAVAVARRHPLSIASLITTIPLFLIISLFSTVVCPPPSSKTQSTISKYIFTPLGLTHPPQAGSLHQSLCYPANAYYDAVLEPYIYPLVEKAQGHAINHPVYVKGVEPSYSKVRDTTTKVWNGPIAPVARRLQRELKRAYLTLVQPHIPYVKTKFNTLTAPYTSRIAALHNQYLHPQLAAAQLYANSAKDQSVKSYNYIASHPVTGQAGKLAHKGYQVGRKRSIDAYNFSKPHVIRGAKEAERITREILGPRVIRGLEIGGKHAARGYGIVKGRAVAVYKTHLDPHLGPHITRATTILRPYIEILNQKVYRPYIRPSLESILPSVIFAPQPPKSFWAMFSEFLPTTGGSRGETKGRMDDNYSRVTKEIKTKTASVKSKASSASSSLSRSASPSPSPSVVKAKGEKMTRGEMDKTREELKTRIEEQGKKGYKQVKAELVTLHKDILNTKFPMLLQGSRAEIEQDINYVVTGLDKLYSKSPVLKKDQVVKSSQQADAKLQTKVTKIKARIATLKTDWFNLGRPIVQRAFQPLDDLVSEKDALAEEMAWVEDVNPKDFTKFNQLQVSIDGWKDKYMGLHNGTIKDKTLMDPSANIDKNLADLYTEIEDVVEGFRVRVGILKRSALDRVEAREVLAAEKSSSGTKVASAASSVSILPIIERAAEGLGAAPFIGKGKQQVEDALRQAGSVITGSSTPSASVASAASSVSILPIIERAAEGLGAGAIIVKGKEQIEDALSQVGSAITGSAEPSVTILPIAERAPAVGAGVGGIIGKGKQQVEDALRQAGSAITGSAEPSVYILPIAERAQAVGAGVGGIIGKGKQQVEDALNQASAAIAGTTSTPGHVEAARSAVGDLANSASSVYHDATRSAISAVGATPSPEGVAEHAQSIYNAASASVASAASGLPDTGAQAALESILAQVQVGAAGAYAQAQDGIHQASKSIVSAAGYTPAPEGAAEYAASVAAQARSSASSIGSVVSEAVHQATRSVISAGGGTGVPENMNDYASQASLSAYSIIAAATQGLGSLVGDVPASASSVGSVVSQAVHDGTRSVISAVGGTPSPESVNEHASSIYNQASASASSAASVLASAVHEGTRSVSSAVGAVPTPECVPEHYSSLSSAAASQVSSLSSQIASLLGPAPTPAPIADYFASLGSSGKSYGNDILNQGSSLLASLSSEYHTATRSIAKQVGGTAAPEGLGERVEDALRRVGEVESDLEERLRRAVGRDEL